LTSSDETCIVTPIVILNNIRRISAGYDFKLVLDNNDQIYQMGDSENKLIILPKQSKIRQIFTGNRNGFILTYDQVYSFGNNEDGQLGVGDNRNRNIPTLVSVPNTIIKISSGMEHTLMLTRDGIVYSCGKLNTR
jgi:hypothetical protein